MARRKQYDWGAIEREYRLGQKSLRTLSSEFGPTPGAISKRAKKGSWVQDKSQEVREKTRAALLKEAPKGNTLGNTEGNTPTQEDVDRAVETNVRIVREHRADIHTGRALVDLLAGQLRDAAENRAELKDEIREETQDSGKDGKPDYRRRNRLMKAVSLPAHASVLRDLSTALKNLIPLERQAFNLDDDSAGKALKDLIAKLSPESRKMVADALEAE